VPVQVRTEGLAERTGDLILQCASSNFGAAFTGDYVESLPTSITNRIDSNNLTTDASISVDYGAGYTPLPVPGLVNGSLISFNGVRVTIPASGNFFLKISGVRANIRQFNVATGAALVADLSLPLSIDRYHVQVASVGTGLFATLYSSGITCVGSPLPGTITVANLFAGTAFFSTRVTEGFGNAFSVRASGEDSGTRFLVKYTGFPAASHLYVPDLVAGSDAAQPTAGGDLGVSQSTGQYLPGSGTLLLARVLGADASGAGGTLVPIPTGTSPVTLNGATEVTLTNGVGYAVYEVVDSNPVLIETAQFPTFAGVAPQTAPAVAQESISLAPVSTIGTASTSAPVPRFATVTPGSDCGVLGDCDAGYFPKLDVLALPVTATLPAGGSGVAGYVYVRNQGGGIMSFAASVSYANGSGWLSVSPDSGQNGTTLQVYANAKGLAAGVYKANVVIDAGPIVGSQTVPVTLTVTAALPPSTPKVTIDSVVNAATFESTPLVAGSLATIKGSHLSGNKVAVTFDGMAADLLYLSDTQINLRVPDGLVGRLGAKTSASVVATVDNVSSTAQTIPLSPAWPAVFDHGVRNQDNSENTADTPAVAGSVLQIYGTGIPSNATVTARIGDRSGLVPMYAGPAPDVPGVQQVNVTIPQDVSGEVALVLCASVDSKDYCSAEFGLHVK
jgi:uncharacterized protein (TIGR03437 family)